MCEFRAGRYRSSLEAAINGWMGIALLDCTRGQRARVCRVQASRTLLRIRLERRSVRAAIAQARERYTSTPCRELRAAVRLAPQQPELPFELASAYYLARDYEARSPRFTVAARYPDEARLMTLEAQALVQLQRADEAVPILKTAERRPDDAALKLALGRAYLQSGHYAAAIPLLEPLWTATPMEACICSSRARIRQPVSAIRQRL